MIPVNDEDEHVPALFCWCKPTIVEKGVLHNSEDCRELVEVVTGELMEPDKYWRLEFNHE